MEKVNNKFENKLLAVKQDIDHSKGVLATINQVASFCFVEFPLTAIAFLETTALRSKLILLTPLSMIVSIPLIGLSLYLYFSKKGNTFTDVLIPKASNTEPVRSCSHFNIDTVELENGARIYTMCKKAAKNPCNRLVFFHGRMETFAITHRDLKKLILKDPTLEVITIDYPHIVYNQESGSLTAKKMSQFIDEFYIHLINKTSLSGNLTIYGYSLGGHMVDLLKTHDLNSLGIDTIVYDRTFDHLANRAQMSGDDLWYKNKRTQREVNKFLAKITPHASAKNLKTLHFKGQYDGIIPDSISSEKKGNDTKHTYTLKPKYNQLTKAEHATLIGLFITNLVALNSIYAIGSCILAITIFLRKNPNYFNTHCLDYAFNFESCFDIIFNKNSEK